MTINCSPTALSIAIKSAITGNWESKPDPVQAAPGAGGDAMVNADYDQWFSDYAPSPTTLSFVSPDGVDDAARAGTREQPWKTFSFAIARMQGGGQVRALPGFYPDFANFISTRRVNIPSGTRQQYTTIVADEPFTVWTRQNAQSSLYYDCPIHLGRDNGTLEYVRVDGIGVLNMVPTTTQYENSSCLVRIAANQCYISRCIGISANGGRFRSFIQLADDESFYNVAEDCFGIGSFHYPVYAGTGGQPTTATCLNHIARRVFVYPTWYAYVLDPSAPFCVYGSDDSTNTQVGNVLFANCGVFYAPDVFTNSDNCSWAGILYLPKCVTNVRAWGCFSVHGDGTYGVVSADAWGPNSSHLAAEVDQCVSAMSKRSASAGNMPYAVHKNTGRPGMLRVKDSLFDSSNIATLFPPSGITADSTGNELRTPGGYMMRRSNGQWLDKQIYMIGTVGERYDDPGFETVRTDRPMWPLPYQDAYKAAIEWAAANVNRGAYDFPVNVPASGTAVPNILAGDETYPYTTLTELVFRCEGAAMPNLATEVYA